MAYKHQIDMDRNINKEKQIINASTKLN